MKSLNFLKKNPTSKEEKSYTQVSAKVTNTTRDILKIKETFSNLQNKKIELVQKIISGEGKLKPCINITTKGPSQKQVIIPMSSDNVNKFVKEFSIYIANINRAFKNIKSDVTADFICVENKRVVITTNKIASPLDLQTIKKYIKNMYYIEANQMKSLRFFN